MWCSAYSFGKYKAGMLKQFLILGLEYGINFDLTNSVVYSGRL